MMNTRIICATVIGVLCLLAPLAEGQNLLTNPGFDTNITGWTNYTSPVNATFAWITDDATGGTGSVLAQNTYASGNQGISLEQCIPVIAGEAYSVSGMLLIPSGQATTGRTALAVQWKGDLACTVSLGLGPVSTANLDGVFDIWTNREKRGILAPTGAVAARVYVLNSKYVDGGMFSSLADDVSFTVDPLFADGFETASVGEWSTSSP